MPAHHARFSLDGQVAVVTGAGGGIGHGGAVALAEAGADVALIGRSVGKLKETAAAVEKTGRRALIVQADVTDETMVETARARIAAELGNADILFNNAGITSPKTLNEMTLDEWCRVLDVNLTGAFLCSRAFSKAMVARGRGRIINMGSILSGRGMANRTAYSATKAGLANFGAAMAFELGPHGITVNTIRAGVTKTPALMKIPEHDMIIDAATRRNPTGRMTTPQDVADAIVALSGEGTGFINGETIGVDGGEFITGS